MLTHARLLELLHYDPKTGVFTWRKKTSNRAAVGAVAGSINAHGYRRISVDGVLIRAHRLAWFYEKKRWPRGDVDHVNGDRDDNRLCNLRDVPRVVNAQNLRRATKVSKTGLLGASLCRYTNHYVARIGVAGRSINLGRFDTPEEAHEAYVKAKRKLHVGNTL